MSAASALKALLTEVDKLGVRELVAGWNGEKRPEGPHFSRHPSLLGATLRTNCGNVYKLDEAIRCAHAAIAEESAS